MHNNTIVELLAALKSGEFSSKELTRHYIERIKVLDSLYNAFITPLEEQALQAAEQADADRARGKELPLGGIPIAHKDIFCTRGIKSTCGSRMLDNFISPYDATVVENLTAAGAILIGKTNMDEFAMGSSSETSFYGPVKNPWDLERVPGGSSGGSATAVAARMCAGATGTDTGGSIRQPASLCGISGLKPTYGRVSRWGMVAFASSLDQAGPMTQTAADAALMLNAMAGHDAKDSTSITDPVPDYSARLNDKICGIKLGLCKEYFEDGLDANVQQCVMDAVLVLEKMGARISEVSLPNTRQSVPAYYVIAPAECSANLARYDGVRFGHRCENPVDLGDLYRRSRSEGFGAEVKRRIMIGTFALSAGYYDAYYRKAQQIRRLIKNDFVNVFEEVDMIIGPIAPSTAFRLGEKIGDPVTMYLQDIFTIASNLAGLPAASFPAGFVDGLPIGIQVIGNYLDEASILQLGHQFQLQTDWHKRTPASAEL
ncbi:MAG: Asp-tRNA(Asn)/Glu-tRNA(Gln) amidotransferase subunit GatA [Gammaproteobacteria bacterium]|nr:Asp-tRNA(Asn)/Glu-tRNA(Gln) amidotransferase subunit GatA [Gammaproteobacteria bacterium]